MTIDERHHLEVRRNDCLRNIAKMAQDIVTLGDAAKRDLADNARMRKNLALRQQRHELRFSSAEVVNPN